MAGKNMEPRRDDAERHGRSQSSADSTIKRLWVDRVPRFIDQQRDGIDTWPADGQQVPVTFLVDAYMTITQVLGEDGRDAGRVVEFYMRPRGTTVHEHMASLLYGPPREGLIFKKKRHLRATRYRV